MRTILNGVTVADSTNVMIMHEPGRLAVYYFPIEDVRRDLLIPSSKRTSSPLKSEAQYWSIQVGATIAQDAVWSYPNPPDGWPDVSKHVALYWNSMDRWLEEDDEVFVHPRDPYHRIDILESSRQIRVVLASLSTALGAPNQRASIGVRWLPCPSWGRKHEGVRHGTYQREAPAHEPRITRGSPTL